MDSEQNQRTTFANSGYINSSALQIRLDVEKLLENIKLNLSGIREVYFQNDDGTIGSTLESIGEPKANKTGVQSIISFMAAHINIQVVQGNYIDEELYYLNVDDIEDALREEIIVNAPYWGIRDEHIVGIYHQVLKAITDFKTRLIHNKERDSYTDTIRTLENNTIKQGNNGFNMFKE